MNANRKTDSLHPQKPPSHARGRLTLTPQKMTDTFYVKTVTDTPAIKKTVNVQLDADVIEWLQSGGKGYQTRMNAILREAMLHCHTELSV
jgi:uncharacterized protein (DUF4415 family)